MSTRIQTLLFPSLVVLSLALLAVMGVLDGPLRTTQAPWGILSYELAGSGSSAQRILDSWNPTARIYAGIGLGFDYLFLIVYSTTLALGCLRVARATEHRAPGLGAIGLVLACGQPVAGVLDAIENGALIVMLVGSASDGWAKLAAGCAMPKLLIVVLGFAYMVVGSLVVVLGSSRSSGGISR